MVRRLWRVAASLSVALLAVVTPIAAASSSPTSHTLAGTACPSSITSFPKTITSLPWMSATYRAKYTSTQLAWQVLDCEIKLRPVETAFYSEVALIGLNKTANLVYQNQNMWLADTAGKLTPEADFLNLGIPQLTLEDGPNGAYYRPPASQVQPTLFPNEMALAATMSPALAAQYGTQLGLESATVHYLGVQAPDLNLDRIPNWGRSPETFGEDPVLAGEMGAQEAIGILQNSPLLVLKHFGVYGQDTNRKFINFALTGNAIADTYLRPFAIATNEVAQSKQVPTGSQILMMCSYGDLNKVRSCSSPVLRGYLQSLPYSGIVRSDLDTVTPAYSLLHAGVQLIKPLDVKAFEPYSIVNATLKKDIKYAALKVLKLMFDANLVSETYVANSHRIGQLNSTIHANSLAVANLVEARAAVLLKNVNYATPGSLPATSAESNIAVIAPGDLIATCKSVATNLSSMLHNNSTCTTYPVNPHKPTTLFSRLRTSGGGKALSATTTWTAPSTGLFEIADAGHGSTFLSFNGSLIDSEPGLGGFYDPHYSTISALKGHKYSFSITWNSLAPTVTIWPLASEINAAVSAAKGASMAIVLAHDLAKEGMDRTTLALPYGQDAIISAVGAAVPTSVGLITSGPVTMPWLSSVDSVMEFWNSVGNDPVDYVANQYAYTYARLLDGQLTPSGHLPITFPADENQSPMSLGTGPNRYAYWPGIHNTANLNIAPLNGLETGYQWYLNAGWPVLFPFGFGLTYATMTPSFKLATHCTNATTANQICLPVSEAFSNDIGQPARTAIQIYVSQPSTQQNPRPPLVFGGLSYVTCRDASGVTGQCATSAHIDTTISSLDVGQWSSSTSSYQFVAGCYSFVVANNEADASAILATPSLAPNEIVHASAPFSASTTLSAGKCPG